MKIMSFNVKHIPLEDIFFLWKKRYEKVAEFIEHEKPDILGMQEITKKGKKFLEKKLSNYNIVGESRHSIIFTNEYNPILIKKDYKILNSNTYSLYYNINKLCTKTKDDNFPRICVIAHIKKNDIKYMIVNTHIDNSSFNNKKRLLNILKEIIETNQKSDEFVIIMGDYNMTIGNKNLLNFSKDFLNPFKDYKEGTFPSLPDIRPLDHIFIDKRLSFSCDKIHKNSNERYFLSDHNPISCLINEKK